MSEEVEKDSKDELSAEDNGGSSPNESSESDSDSSDSSDSDSEYECSACNKTFSGALPLRQHLKGAKHKKALARKKKERKMSKKGDDDEEDEENQGQIVPEPYEVCRTCKKEFSGVDQYQMHLRSKTHKQRVLHASILERAKEDGKLNVDKLRDLYLSKKTSPRKPSDEPDGSTERQASSSKTDEDDLDEYDEERYDCKDCGKTFCGLVPFGQHLTSKTHAKQVRKKKLLGKITSENVEEGSVPPNDVSCLTVEDDVLVCKVCSTSFSGPQNAVDHLKSQNHSKKLDKYLRKLERRKKKATELKEHGAESMGTAELKEPGAESMGKEDKEVPEGRDETPNIPTYKSTSV